MKHLFCYDLHDSEKNRDNYVRLIETMDKRFGPMIRFTDSVYLFETKLTDLDELRWEIREAIDFIKDLEFYVFRLADEMDKVTTVRYCEALMEYCLEENKKLFAKLKNE